MFKIKDNVIVSLKVEGDTSGEIIYHDHGVVLYRNAQRELTQIIIQGISDVARLRYDPAARMAYVHTGGLFDWADSTIQIGDQVNADLDSSGNVVGVEIFLEDRKIAA